MTIRPRSPLRLALALALAPLPAAAAVPQVYLVQTSGWMLPFFTEPTAATLRALLVELVGATRDGGRVVVADFNQNKQIPGRTSPGVEFDGFYDPAAITAAVARLTPRRQPNGTYTDADFNGALVATITDILKNQSGIVWMITNNKNSKNNSQAIAGNTRDFAERLNNTDALANLVAYPIRLPAETREFKEKGLIIYGIAYGDEAASALRAETRDPAIRQLFPDPAMQLKPLDRAAFTFTPQATTTPGLTATIAPDGTLLIDAIPGAKSSLIDITGTITSNYYPQTIQSALMSARWTALDGIPVPQDADNMIASLDPAEIHDLQPQQTLQDVHLRLAFPALPRPSGLAGLLQPPVAMTGTVAIELTHLKLGLEPGFSDKLAQIAALDQLPSVFSNYLTTTTSETIVPLRFQVRFSSLPLILALSAAALAALLATAAILLRRTRAYAVDLGGQTVRVRARPFERLSLTNVRGQPFQIRGTVFGRAQVTPLPQQTKRG